MKKIVPHLWFDNEALEAAKFYTSLFDDSRIEGSSKMEGTPSGTVETAKIVLSGQEFMLLSAGPLFKFTPAVVLHGSAARRRKRVERLWNALRPGGGELMPLGEYPFSDKYGWLADKYGLSWQIMYNGGKKVSQKIAPALMFVGKQCGKAEEAIRYYASVFSGASVDGILHYGPDDKSDREGTLKFGAFTLEGAAFFGDGQRLRSWLFVQRSYLPDGFLREPGRNRLLLGKTLGPSRSGAMRLAEGQVRAFLADRAQGSG